jgi:CPA2 family monovalent cation:H+ antiporter-2
MPVEAQSLILAGAFISITLNPLVFKVIEPAQAWIRSRSSLARVLERVDDPLAELPMTVASSYVTNHVVVVGYGRVGGRIGEALAEQRVPLVVAEQNRETVEGLRKRGIHAVAGDAADPAVLIQAHIARAAMLVIAVPDTLRARRMIETARILNPSVQIIVRTHNDEEAALLRKESGGEVFVGEHELALSMLRHVLNSVAPVK